MFPFFLDFVFASAVTPFCVQDQRTEYTVGLNEQTVITCEVQSDPSDASFKWFYNNSSETTELKNFLTSGSRSVLKYTPTSRYSYGTLFCTASNSLGMQSKPCVFNVMPAGEYRFFIFLPPHQPKSNIRQARKCIHISRQTAFAPFHICPLS